MFRDDKVIYTSKHIHFVLNHGALGDMISSLPAVAYGRQTTSPSQLMTVWVMEHQIPLVAHLLGRLHNLRVMPLHKFNPQVPPEGQDPKWLAPGNAVSNGAINNQITRNRVPLVDYAHLTLLDRWPRDDAERNYPHTALLTGMPHGCGEPYVVISVGATSDNKIIPEHVIEAVIRWCVSRGYKPVILGKSETLVKAIGEDIPLRIRYRYDNLPQEVRALALDMRDKTGLLEARNWLGHAQAVVGVDGGLLHLAGTTNTKIVYGYTTVRPEDRGIVRYSSMNWEVEHVGPRALSCTGCQGNMQLMHGHDFRYCVYKDNLCVDRLHGDDFIAALEALGL